MIKVINVAVNHAASAMGGSIPSRRTMAQRRGAYETFIRF